MCGVVGIYGEPEAARAVRSSLFAQQHRGQDGAGIAVASGGKITMRRGLGLTKGIYSEEILASLPGTVAIGHVRYPTQGSVCLDNTQPHLVEISGAPPVALASNGDIVNYKSERQRLEDQGISFQGENDGELLALLLAAGLASGAGLRGAVGVIMARLKGAYSVVAIVGDRLVAFRDPWGVRPLSVGTMPHGVAVCSESVGLDILRATEVREVEPGTMLVADAEGFTVHGVATGAEPHHCVFELIYFARPDAAQFGETVYTFRKRLGSALAAKDVGLQADIVFPIPDSSNVIALGYSEASGVPFGLGLTRNHYVGRTFIAPLQRTRDESVREKFNPVPGFFSGRSVVLVDDSIVRGSTLRKLVSMVRGAGAREIHVRIGSPPIRHPCFYGIDTPTEEQLLAHRMSEEEIRDHLGADSLHYLSLEDLRAVPASPDSYCMACFSGDYPLGKKEEILPISVLTQE
ncbi:amidophosphoribosyltransferase [bacterium]|nr:amidophosphoribosyltransferase [bacterium]